MIWPQQCVFLAHICSGEPLIRQIECGNLMKLDKSGEFLGQTCQKWFKQCESLGNWVKSISSDSTFVHTIFVLN